MKNELPKDHEDHKETDELSLIEKVQLTSEGKAVEGASEKSYREKMMKLSQIHYFGNEITKPASLDAKETYVERMIRLSKQWHIINFKNG